MAKLNLDRDKIDLCRELADGIVHPIQKYIDIHSTVSIERAVLRLLGLEGAMATESGMMPLANLVGDGRELARKGLEMGAHDQDGGVEGQVVELHDPIGELR